MDPHAPPSLFSSVHRLLADERRRQATDRDLLQAFVQRGENDAFTELLRRHGPMVLHLALHLLHHRQDAEDVFQATFLTLARQARSLRSESSLAAWLHRVAWRLAVRSRSASKRRNKPLPLSTPEQRNPADEISLRESQELLHQELVALPEHLRLPLVLCYLQGRTRDEAARRLGWSLATLKRRLEQGRKLLHARLSRRGVTLPALLSATLLASAEAPASLAASTLGLAASTLAGSANVPASVAVLLAKASGSVKAKAAWALVLLLAVCTGAGSWVCRGQSVEPAAAPEARPASSPPAADKGDKAPPPHDRFDDPLPEGAIARLGSTRFRHSEKVWCLAFSPDGKTIASGGCDEVVRFWDVKTGRQVGVSSRRYCSAAAGLAYSPDGTTLAVRDWSWDKFGISLLDAATAKERRFVTSPRYPRGGHAGDAVAFSPDGKILAAANPVGEICLYDPAGGKETAVLGKHDHHNVPVLAFSPDGRMLASSAQDATIRLWDVTRRKALFVLRSEDTTAFPLVFSRDGKWLISGGGTQKTPQQWDSPWESPTLRIWDTATGKQLRVFKDTEVRGAVRSLALAPDGRTLAVSCEDKLRLWDVHTGKVLRTLPGSRSPYWPIVNLCFSPDGKLLAGGVHNMVGLWDVESGRLLNLDANESAGGIASAALSCDGRLLAVGDSDGCLSLWDFRSQRLIRRFHGHDSGVRQVAFSPDDKTLASISEYGRLRAWKVADGRQRYQFPVEAPNGFRPTDLAFAPDGRLLAYAYFCDRQEGGPRGIRLLDGASGAEQQNLTIPDAVHGWFVGISFSPDGRHLIGMTVNGEIYGWRRESDGFVKKGLLDRERFGSRVAYTGRGFFAVNVFSGKSSSLRDIESGRPKGGLAELPLLGGVLAVSRDGRYLAAGPSLWRGGDPTEPRDGTLRVCEMSSGQEVLRWRLPPYTACNALAFAPDGRTLVAAMTDTTVLLWDLSPPGKETAKEARALWADLADKDAAKAYWAVLRLSVVPDDALALLRSHLKPVEGVDEERIGRLVADLDSDAFAVRERAAKELRQLGELAEPALRKALAARPALEMRRRVQELLDDMAQHQWRPTLEILRQLRAIEVLERIGTPEARKSLEMLAGGAAGARLTREARAAVQRSEPRP